MGPTSIVVAFRMQLGAGGLDASYLARARGLCARAEGKGGRLIAWSAALVAIAWDLDGVEDAVEVVSGLEGAGSSGEIGWACGIAQGVLEPLSSDGERMDLAWGEPLVVAASLARIARPGEVLIDGDVAAVRRGALALTGSRSASDGGRRVRGWQLDLERPWRAAPSEAHDEGPAHANARRAREAWPDELASADVLELIEAGEVDMHLPGHGDPEGPSLVGDRAAEDLARLERKRHHAEGRSASERCKASLALAMALAALARPEDALIQAVDALARAREDGDSRALAACYALLSKLYVAVGKVDAAGELRALASGAAGFRP